MESNKVMCTDCLRDVACNQCREDIDRNKEGKGKYVRYEGKVYHDTCLIAVLRREKDLYQKGLIKAKTMLKRLTKEEPEDGKTM